jgi:hypothetical protein
VFRDPRKHLRPELIAVMESKDEILRTGTSERSV